MISGFFVKGKIDIESKEFQNVGEIKELKECDGAADGDPKEKKRAS